MFHFFEQKQQNTLKAVSVDVLATMEKKLSNDLDYIKMLGQMRIRNELTPKTFNDRTKDFLSAHMELINFTWVDKDFYIRAVSPLQGNAQILGLHLDLPEPARVSKLAQETREAHYTSAFEAIQGDCSFEVWHPVYDQNTFLGLFAGVYSCEKLLASVLVDSISKEYLVSLTDENHSFLAEVNSSQGSRTDQTYSIALNLDNNLVLSVTRMRLPFADLSFYILAFIVVVLAGYNLLKIRNNITKRLKLLSELKIANSSLKESEKRFKLMFESSPIGMILIDNHGRISSVNPLICDLLNYPEQQLIKQPIEQLLPEAKGLKKQGERHASKLQLLESSNQQLESTAGVNSRGEKVALQIATAPMQLNGHWHTLVSVIDNTERKRLIDELKIQNEKLNTSNQKLVQTNEQLERFAYICSHDLQEPVRMVQSFGPLVQERLAGISEYQADTKSQEYLSYMIGGANRARDMIDDILLYCRDDQPITNFEVVNLNDICSEVEETLGKQLVNNRGRFIWQANLPEIMGVSSQVFQLLLNLVSNGLKFNTSRQPTVELNAVEQLDNWHINVIDNGIGIEQKYQQQIFEIFERLHGNSEYPGTGIGLASCQKIAERHNAVINLTSEPGHGSNFCIIWPKVDVPSR